MRRWLKLWHLGLLLTSWSAWGAEDLLRLYREAQTTSAAYQAAKAAAEAELENENIAFGQLLPNLSIGGSYNKNNTERQIANGPGEDFRYGSYAYNLNLRQPLFRLYTWATYQQAKEQGKAALQRLNQAGNDLAVRLTSNYFEALYTEEQLRLLAAQKAAVEAQMKAAERALIAGSGTRIDIDEAKARYDLLLAQEVEAQNNQKYQQRSLGAFVNRPISSVARLNVDAFKPVSPNPDNLDAWIAAAEEANAEYQAKKLMIAAAEQEVTKAQSGHYPTLDLVASTGKSQNDNLTTLNRFGDSNYTTSAWGVQLNVPLFAGGQVAATTRQAQAKLEQVRQEAEDIRRNIGVQMGREFDNVAQGIAKIRALELAEASGRQTVLSTKKGVQAGVRSMLDVLEIERQYYSTLRDLAQARYAYLIASLKMKGIAGVLSDADIEALNARLKIAP